MKYLVVTDIHGSSISAQFIKDKFNEIKADKIVLLGDILYHGARNELPEGYAPKSVTEILNSVSDNIIAVRGNCDSEVDQMVLNFNLNESAFLDINGNGVFLTHGHKVNPETPANFARNTFVLYGHFHVNKFTQINGVNYVNLASITLPKNGNPKSYAVIDENGIVVFDINDNKIEEYKF